MEIEKIFSSRKSMLFLLTAAVLFFSVCIIKFYGGQEYAGDGLRHYLVSRWCWKHPDLLFYHWGKPFFTLITSPFSHLGYKGIQFFNLGCAALGAYWLYKIAKHYAIANAALAVVFVFFSPVFFTVIPTGLTEPMFFCIIAGSSLLLLKEKYTLSCLAISFLPFVRSEGNMIIALFFVVLLLRKKYFHLPLLAVGTLVYSIAGGLYYKDFFWVWTMNPYNGANKDFYGQGEWNYFLNAYDFILGIPLSILFVAGILFYLRKLLKKKIFSWLAEHDVEVFLLLGSFVVYFTAHSIFWWKGLFNSFGLIRAIAGTSGLVALTCLRGLDQFFAVLPSKKILRVASAGLLSAWVIIYPFRKTIFPPQLSEEDKVTEEALQWFKNSPYKNKLVYYLNPYLGERLNRDPFDDKEVRELWGLMPAIREWGYNVVPDSTIVFWDAHYGPNEARIPLDSISSDPHFELVKVFKPATPFTVIGGHDYGIYAFAKKSGQQKTTAISSTLFFDLEHPDEFENMQTVTTGAAYSGNHFAMMNDSNQYGVLYPLHLESLAGKSIHKIKYSCYILSGNMLKGAKVVLSITANGKALEWMSRDITMHEDDKNKWINSQAEFSVMPDAYADPNAVMKIYVWNPGAEQFSVDDIKIEFTN